MSKKFRTEILGVEVEYDTMDELIQIRDKIVADRKDSFCSTKDDEDTAEDDLDLSSEVKNLTWKTDLVDITVTEGDPASFRVEVNEDTEVTYKLFRDGSDTNESTTTGQFSLESAEVSDSGTKFYILATADGYQDLKSTEVTYTVNPKPESEGEVDPEEGEVTMEEVGDS